MEPLKIGISARLLYPDSRRIFLPTKSVQYLEQSVASWVMSGEVLAFMVPALSLAAPHAPTRAGSSCPRRASSTSSNRWPAG